MNAERTAGWDMHGLDLGPCCKCGAAIGVSAPKVLIDLDRRAPEGSLAKWGCVVCGAEGGAIAVICGACEVAYQALTKRDADAPPIGEWLVWAMAGDGGRERVPIAALSGSVRHDLNKHPELVGAASPVRQARDLLLEHLEQHAKVCPEHPLLCREIANVLAFLAHSMGANAADLRAFPKRLIQYDMLCPGCNSPRHAASVSNAPMDRA